MRKVNYKKYLCVTLLLILIVVNMPHISIQSFYASLGASTWSFTIGLLIGFIVTRIFMFFYNIFKPDKKIKLSTSDRVIAGLVIAIVYSLLI